MVLVTYGQTTYECSQAIKGPDYVHLMNEDNELIVAFDGITDFSDFSIYGEWSNPTAVDNCRLAAVGDDRVIRPGSRRGSEIPVIQVSTVDLVPESSPLPTGTFYFVYE